MKKKFFELMKKILHYSVIAILFITALMFFFVFTINWEDWFFGIKLDGLPAGLCLLSKGLTAAVLGYLIIRYPQHVRLVAGLALVFFCYMFIDSAMTMQKLTAGHQSFSVLLGIFVLIPLVFLIMDSLANHHALK